MTGSRLVNGSMKLHNELEEKLAAFLGKEAALVFTTGYQVNLATFSALLCNKKCVAVIDRNVHASIYDGVRLGAGRGRAHGALQAQRPRVARPRARGARRRRGRARHHRRRVQRRGRDRASLPELVRGREEAQARASSSTTRTRSASSAPAAAAPRAHFGVSDQVDLIGGTFSKSLASIGGWLVGERKVLDYIQHFAPSFMFAASAAPPCVAAAMAALDVMQEETWRIEKLRENFTYMRDELKTPGLRARQHRDRGHPDLHPPGPAHDHDVEGAPRRARRLHEPVHFARRAPEAAPCCARATWPRTRTEHLDRGLEGFPRDRQEVRRDSDAAAGSR